MDQSFLYNKDCCHPSSMYPQSRQILSHPNPHQQHHLSHSSSGPNHPQKPLHATAREDFTGLDNDALDFSQLEDFIANETDTNGSYFADTLANSEASKHTQNGQALRDRILVVTSIPFNDGSMQYGGTKSGPPSANPRSTVYSHGPLPHNLPDSPPDSGSEPPYSPTDPGSRSPNHKTSNLSGRRNLHDLLLHPMYPQNPVGANGPIIPLLQHDLAPMEAPLSNIAPIHVPPLIPISPSAVNSSPSSNVTLTTLDGTQPSSSLASVETSESSVAPSNTQSTGSQEDITTFYTQLQPVQAEKSRGKKRKSSGSGTGNNGKISMIHVKLEPEMSPSDSNASSSNNGGSTGNGVNIEEEFFDVNGDPAMFMDPNYQCIKFQPFQETTWHSLADDSFKELVPSYFKVDADKGFNFSNADDAFVCQKKNHFQITCHVKHHGEVKYIKTSDGYKPVENFYVHFYGVKAESPNQCIKIEQSQSDRSKKPFHPVPLEVNADNVAKLTVGRLHFNETTSNNMRKKGKPNPDQRYFYLVVALHAHCMSGGSYPIIAQSSQRIIVRASNPGQFESDMELSWQKGQTSDSIYHAGRVGINTDRPEEALVVYGNCKVTGQIMHPSDMRAKEGITEMDSKEQLKNIQQLRVVRYNYNPEFARLMGLNPDESVDTGIIAQEVQKIIPEAVKATGDIDLPSGQKVSNFLVVNKERIFMENIGAVKELCKVTGKLETRIDHLEKITKANRSSSNNSSLRSSSSRSSKSKRVRARDTAEYLCSNKCVQLLIVILVLVMAFCLVAMAALYVLEYHKRSYGYYNSHHLYNSSREYILQPHGIYVDPSLRNPSTFYPSAMLHHNPTKNPKSAKTNFANAAKSSEQLEQHPLVKPKVLGKPSHCYPHLPYLESVCGTYCCGGASIPRTGSEYLEIERKNHVAGSGLGNSIRTPSQTTAVPPSQNHTEDAISNVFSSNPVQRNGLDAKRRRRRQTEENPKLLTVPSIQILSLNINQTLDSTYCMLNSEGYHDCVSPENRYFSSANLTYHVPLSKYWDELNISLIFKFPSRTNVSSPQICQKNLVQPYCRIDDGNLSLREGHNSSSASATTSPKNTFTTDLSVGSSPYSRYTIRFSSSPEETDKICSTSNNVFEFNFHFYRVCHE